jgi:hypothetical protein
MSRAWLACSVALVMCAMPARAEEQAVEISFPPLSVESEGFNQIKANPGLLLSGIASLDYERLLPGHHLTLLISPVFAIGNAVTTGHDVSSQFGVGLQASLHIFVFEEAPRGFYFGPLVGAMYLHATKGGLSASTVSPTVLAMVGWSWLLGSFALDGGVGLGAHFGSLHLANLDYPQQGFTGQVRVALGYGF